MGAVRTFQHVGEALDWLRGHVPTGVCADHRHLSAGQALLAWPGGRFDPRTQVEAAVKAGAVACLVEAEGIEAFEAAWSADAAVLARVAALPGLKAQAGLLAAQLFKHPSQAMDVVAITGTNGKTSCSWWVAQAMAKLGRQTSVIGTLGVGRMTADGPQGLLSTGLTTPDAVALQSTLAAQRRDGVAVCAMEASSIGLAEGRLSGTHIRVAAFTNFTQDHLDWHGDMAAYWAAKRRLFDWPGLEAAVIQVDDPQGQALLSDLVQGGRIPSLWAVGTDATGWPKGESPAKVGRVLASEVSHGPAGLQMRVTVAWPEPERESVSFVVSTGLIGRFNVHNLLVVAACLLALGVSASALPQALAGLRPVPGRMERVVSDVANVSLTQAALPAVVVDYAHTPDALQQVLASLRPWAAERGGRLWCVFGCGGQRDASKRPLMARAAQTGADAVVLTSDNPRHEDPQAT
jgi:UDP-N-acetylmuramyl-tripeptide synthetase